MTLKIFFLKTIFKKLLFLEKQIFEISGKKYREISAYFSYEKMGFFERFYANIFVFKNNNCYIALRTRNFDSKACFYSRSRKA